MSNPTGTWLVVKEPCQKIILLQPAILAYCRLYHSILFDVSYIRVVIPRQPEIARGWNGKRLDVMSNLSYNNSRVAARTRTDTSRPQISQSFENHKTYVGNYTTVEGRKTFSFIINRGAERWGGEGRGIDQNGDALESRLEGARDLTFHALP